MNTNYLSLISIISACLFAPHISHAGDYGDAAQEANSSINTARSVNYEGVNRHLQAQNKCAEMARIEDALSITGAFYG